MSWVDDMAYILGYAAYTGMRQYCDHDWKGIYRWMDMPLMVQGLYFGESLGWWLVGSRCTKCGKEHRV